MRQVLNVELIPVLSLLVIIVDQIQKFILTGARAVYGDDRGNSGRNLAVNFAAIGWGIKSNTNALCKEVAGILVNRVQIQLVLV